MQRMALPVVLTAEGTTFRLTHNSSKHVLRIVILTSSSLDCVLTHFWLSVALNGKSLRLLPYIALQGPSAPLRSIVVRTSSSLYLPTLDQGIHWTCVG